MRWHYRDPALLWLFPPAYAVHILEELYAGEGFRAWLARIAGSPLPLEWFLLANVAGMALLLVAVRRASQAERAGWMAVAVATTAIVDVLAHLIGMLVTAHYSPGLIVGIVLYVPLGSLALLRAAHQARADVVRRGVLAGVAIQVAMLVAALAVSRSRVPGAEISP
jgi:hypothetical protein